VEKGVLFPADEREVVQPLPKSPEVFLFSNAQALLLVYLSSFQDLFPDVSPWESSEELFVTSVWLIRELLIFHGRATVGLPVMAVVQLTSPDFQMVGAMTKFLHPLRAAESARSLARVKRAEIWASAWWFAATGE
jgi:hypothetical protein